MHGWMDDLVGRYVCGVQPRYKAQPEHVRHIGPTAQDFHQAFGKYIYGDGDQEDQTRISSADADGVMMASIQTLSQQVARQEQLLEKQNGLLQAAARREVALQARLSQIEAALGLHVA